MKEWQSEFIFSKKSDLQKYTTAPVGLISRFTMVLDEVDREELNRVEDRKGRIAQAALFYDKIVIKDLPSEKEDEDLYAVLIKALEDTKQFKPANILKEGYISNQRKEQEKKIAEIIKQNKYSYNTSEIVDLLDFIDKEEPLEVRVRTRKESFPTVCEYDLPPRGKGYALIINVKQFDGHPDMERIGSELDAQYMTNLWRQLGFRIFPENEETRMNPAKSARDIRKQVEDFREKCEEDSVDAVAVFLGSHGRNHTIFSSDGVEMHLDTEFINELQLNDCKDSKGKKRAKIFIVEACRGYNPLREATLPTTHSVAVQDTVCFMAQVPGVLANRDKFRGSWFIVVLAYVLMENACNYELKILFHDVTNLVKIIKSLRIPEGIPGAHDQAPSYEIRGGLGPLYFLPPKA